MSESKQHSSYRGKAASGSAAKVEVIPDVREKFGQPRSLTKYITELTAPLLSSEEERQLIRRAQQEQGVDARNEIMQRNLRLSLWIALKHKGQGVEVEDLVQEGNLGLLRAVEKFNPELGYRFTTYAVIWVKQFIQRAIQNKKSTVRRPIAIWHKEKGVYRATEDLTKQLGRPPTEEEIIERVPYSASEVKDAVYRLRVSVFSIDQEMENDDESAMNRETSLANMVPDHQLLSPREMAEAKEELEYSLCLISKLVDIINDPAKVCERDRHVFMTRYGLHDGSLVPCTLRDVAQNVQAKDGDHMITRERVRQITVMILSHLKRKNKIDLNHKGLKEVLCRLRHLTILTDGHDDLLLVLKTNKPPQQTDM